MPRPYETFQQLKPFLFGPSALHNSAQLFDPSVSPHYLHKAAVSGFDSTDSARLVSGRRRVSRAIGEIGEGGETTLTIKDITARVHLGTYNTANARLHWATKEGFASCSSAETTMRK